MKIIDPILSGSVHASGSLVIPKGTSDQKPSDPKTGSLFVEISDSGSNLVVYNGSGSTGWQTVGEQSPPAVLTPSADIEYLLVAGGGGGGGWGGGGGAGGLLSSSLSSVESGSSFTVTIGAGATATGRVGGDYAAGGDGTDSSIAGTTISTITSTGGGGGGYFNDNPGRDGGSGGGGGITALDSSSPGGSGTSGQGYSGGQGSGAGSSPYHGGGGGGGAGAVGSAGQSSGYYYGGDGGDGKQSNITGTSTYYAGGGGGHTDGRTVNAPSVSSGGQGGGGNGGRYGGSSGAANAENGDTNTGGGGGAAYGESPNGTAGGGGSGVAILAYDSGSVNGAGGIVGDAGNGRKYHQFNTTDTFKVGSTSDFQIVTDSLVSHYDAGDFASRGTSTWTDLQGAYNGTVSGATLDNNFYYAFDNSNDGVGLGDNDIFTLSNRTATWEAWVKFGSTSGAEAIVTKWAGNGNDSWWFGRYNDTEMHLALRVNGTNTLYYSNNNDVSTTDWIHIVITLNGTAVTTYKNGSSIHTGTVTSGTWQSNGSTTTYIGRAANGNYMDGNIAQVRLYDKTLSAAEVLQNYNATKTNFV